MTDNARDVMEYEVAIVGAGPAGLACAIRLKQLKPELSVCVLEKAASLGAHSLSGAVMEPGPLDELLPGWRDHAPALCVPAARDEFLFMTRRKRFKLPTPPQMANHGNFIISLGQLIPILGQEAEKLGVEPSHVALQWTRQQGFECIPIVGATRLEQLMENLKMIDLQIPADDLAKLNAVSAIDLGFPGKFFREDGVRQNNYGGFYDRIIPRP